MNTKLVESLFEIIQSLSEEERLLLEQKLKEPNLSYHQTPTDIEKLTEALAKLRQICAEEDYTLEIPSREDRPNLFVENLNEFSTLPPIWG
jgi:hypothetical protein